MDRPDREKMAEIFPRSCILSGCSCKYFEHSKCVPMLSNGAKGVCREQLDYADQLLALMPDEFKVEDEFVQAFAKDYKETHEALHKVDIEEAKREGIRLAVSHLKMHYCIMAPESMIKEIEKQALGEK